MLWFLDDPYVAAHKFLEKNEISQGYLDEVANFIIKNTQGVVIGQSSSSQQGDPFTGRIFLYIIIRYSSRYIQDIHRNSNIYTINELSHNSGFEFLPFRNLRCRFEFLPQKHEKCEARFSLWRKQKKFWCFYVHNSFFQFISRDRLKKRRSSVKKKISGNISASRIAMIMWSWNFYISSVLHLPRIRAFYLLIL